MTKENRLRNILRRCHNDIVKQLDLSDPDGESTSTLVENITCLRGLRSECEALIADYERLEMGTDSFSAYPVCQNCGRFCPHNDPGDSESECCEVEMDVLDTLIDNFNEEERL